MYRRCQSKTWSQAQAGMDKGKGCSRSAKVVDTEGHWLCVNHYNKPTGFGFVDYEESHG